MYNCLRITFATLMFCLTLTVGTTASNLILKHTLAQTVTIPDKALADKLYQQGVQQYRTGLYSQALQTYQRVLELRRQQNDKASIAQTLNNLGQVYGGLFQSEKALEVLQQALLIRQQLKDRVGEGETLDSIGGIYLALNQDEKALATLQQALLIRREVKDRTGVAVTLSKIGFTYSFWFLRT